MPSWDGGRNWDTWTGGRGGTLCHPGIILHPWMVEVTSESQDTWRGGTLPSSPGLHCIILGLPWDRGRKYGILWSTRTRLDMSGIFGHPFITLYSRLETIGSWMLCSIIELCSTMEGKHVSAIVPFLEHACKCSMLMHLRSSRAPCFFNCIHSNMKLTRIVISNSQWSNSAIPKLISSTTLLHMRMLQSKFNCCIFTSTTMH